MKVSSFGTTRLDFHIYKPEVISQEYEEYKIDTLDIKVGGSVLNTSTLLNCFKIDLTYYTILGNDELSSVSRSALKNHGIKYTCTSSKDSKSPVTFIHLDKTGEKVMFSYDGNTYKDDVIDILKTNCDKYDVFFTSCYEVNSENYIKLNEILKYFYVNSKMTFLDLSPLVYRISKDIWESLLPFITVLSGTENEFKLLNSILNIKGSKNLINKFNINKIYIKKGSKGCTVILNNNKEMTFAVIPVKSKNLTGCGDAFNAGVILGEINNFTTDNIVKLASCFASHVAKIGFEPKKIASEVDLSSYSSK